MSKKHTHTQAHIYMYFLSKGQIHKTEKKAGTKCSWQTESFTDKLAG